MGFLEADIYLYIYLDTFSDTLKFLNFLLWIDRGLKKQRAKREYIHPFHPLFMSLRIALNPLKTRQSTNK